MDIKPLVSVIIPVFNCEKYISCCLDCLKAQTYVNCQFVVVDDGSSDSSPGIIDRFAETDSRFLAVHQQNGGVAAARNTGLQTALGDYIAFVDADDYVDPDFISLLTEAALKTGAEVVMCGYNKVYANRIESNAKPLQSMVITDSRRFWLDFVALCPELWNKLYSRELIARSGADFVMRTGEDYMFNTRLAPFISKAVTITQAPYYYVQMADSLMRSPAKCDNPYTFINAFLDYQACNEVYIKLGVDAYELLCAYAFTAMLHSGEAIGQGRDFYKNQITLLKDWAGWSDFKAGMADGSIMAKLTANGAMGKKLAKLLRLAFATGSLGPCLFPALNKMLVSRKRGGEDFVK